MRVTTEEKKEEKKNEEKEGEPNLSKTNSFSNTKRPITPTQIKRQSVVVSRLNELEEMNQTPELNIPKETSLPSSPSNPIQTKPVAVKPKPRREKEGWEDFLMDGPEKKGKITENEARKVLRDLVFTRISKKNFKLFLAKNPTLKEGRIRKQLLKEIHDTEREYVKSLKIIVEIYLKPLQKSKLIKTEQISQIFGCIENLYSLQAGFLKEMDLEMGAPFPYQPKMGKVFFNWAPYLKVYPDYVNTYDEGDKVLQNLIETKKTFSQFLEKQMRENPECESLPLQGFLIKPVQRIPRYRLLLKDLIGKTPDDHVDYAGLKRALEAIEEVALFINEQKRNTENQKIMQVLEKKLSSVPNVFDFLKSTQRKMKRTSNFKVTLKYDPESKKQDISDVFELYLFNDTVFLLKKRSENDTSAPVYFIIYLIISSIQFEQGSPYLTILSIQKGMKVEFQLIAENPNVDLLDNWKTIFQNHITELQNIYCKNSEMSIKEFQELLENKKTLMVGLPEITKKKLDQDEKHKKTREEYSQVMKEINDDEAQVKLLQKRIQYNKLRMETIDSNFIMFERKIKNLQDEYREILNTSHRADEKLLKFFGNDKETFKEIFESE